MWLWMYASNGWQASYIYMYPSNELIKFIRFVMFLSAPWFQVVSVQLHIRGYYRQLV